MYKKHINLTSIPSKSEVVFVITLEVDPLDDLDYPEVVAIFKKLDAVEEYLKANNINSVGSLLTSDPDANIKDIKFIENIYEISVFDINTGECINV